MLDYSCFLCRNLSQCISKKHGMVQTDIGNDRYNRRDDIGTIEASTQAYFYNGYIHLLFGKILECQSRCQFEE